MASTNEVHSAHAKLAIDAGIPVVVDKPMALDYYETLSLFDYADARGVPITVFFNRLFDSDTLTIKELVKSGELGEIFRYESRFERFRPDLNPAAWRENTPSNNLKPSVYQRRLECRHRLLIWHERCELHLLKPRLQDQALLPPTLLR
ncbi:MAG: gfo/Idh/MocA family oxidoreductase [Actinobacteria bacterium]|nr:gfo/Idh/MocA family oxidoreductase [Actinomycetota bacterium]